MRCTWAWGTSSPITDKPIRLHGTACSKARATFREKAIKAVYSSSAKSKSLSVSFLGIHRGMPHGVGIDVQKSQVLLVFRYFVTRNFPRNDFTKNTAHLLAANGKDFQFDGTVRHLNGSSVTPSFPKRPFPMGESTEIFPDARSASLCATRV